MEELAKGVLDLPEPYGLQLLSTVAAGGDAALLTAISTNPGLVSARVLRRLAEVVEQAPLLGRQDLARALETLNRLAQMFNGYDERYPYPLGLGPIETLAAQVDAGVLRQSAAMTPVTAPAVLVSVTPYYVHALMRQAIEDARGGRWHAGLTLARLTVAAAWRAGTAGERGDARRQAGLDFLLVARHVLLRFPDGRLLQEARARGDEVLAEAQAEGNRPDVGRAAFRIGSLYLDPVMATGSADDVAVRRALRQRLREELGPRMVFEDQDAVDFPAGSIALAEAEASYRLALVTRDGHERGMAAKALLQTLTLRRSWGYEVDEEEFRRLVADALSLLDPDRAPQLRLDVLQMAGASETEQSTGSVAELLTRLGEEQTRETVLAQVSYQTEHDPEAALRLLAEYARVLPIAQDERSRIAASALLRRALRGCAPANLPGLSEATIPVLDRRAAVENWEPRQHSAALLTLAWASGEQDAEAVGLALWEEAARVCPDLFADHTDALALGAAQLTSDAGVSAWNEGDKVGAARRYSEAFSCWYALGLHGRAMEMLRRLDDTLSDAELPVAASILEALYPRFLDLGDVTGQAQVPEVQHLLRRLIAVLERHEVEIDGYLWARQLAKGAMFSALLDVDIQQVHARAHQYHQQVLDQIVELERSVDRNDLVDDADVYLDSNLLTSWVTASEIRAGDSASERLENLRRRFDVLLERDLIRERQSPTPPVLSDAEIRSMLDARTVLLDVYLGMDTAGHMTVHNYVATADRSFLVRIPWMSDLPDAEVFLGENDGRQVYSHPLGLWVASLRDELAGDPGFEGRLTRAAARDLESAVDGLLGHDLMRLLAKERTAGRSHLCVVPHGPLHYFPYHLIPFEGVALGEQFAVSYLPNLHLLRRRTESRPRRDGGTAVLGMTFTVTDPFGVQPLPQSRWEAEAIAEIVGAPWRLDDEVTEEAASEALQTCNSVHLSSHGVHDLAAPAFQSVLLAPSDLSDGRYRAHEVGQLDLRGLDLVTLSACETALGRFDRGDNLRGMPASLLLAGAATVVGTLWEVDANSAYTFFTSFYRQRTEGSDKITAFADAQAETREKHPVYRDWGAFVLMGDWS